MDPTNAPTQGTDAAAPQTSGNGSEGAVPPGVQKRIDELTARSKAAEEAASAERVQREQLAQLLLAQSQQAQRTPPPEPPKMPELPCPEGMDPSIWAAFNMQSRATAAFLAEQQSRALEARLAPALRNLQMSQGEMEFQRAAQGVDPAIGAEARKLLDTWQRAGLTGWTPNDAVVYAAGQAALKRQGRDAQGRFNQQLDPALNGGAPAAALSKPSPQEVPAYADSASDQYNWLKAREYWFKRQNAAEKAAAGQ
jgi:hypothetical protein